MRTFRAAVWTRMKADVETENYRRMQRRVVTERCEDEEAFRSLIRARFTWEDGDEVVFGFISEI